MSLLKLASALALVILAMACGSKNPSTPTGPTVTGLAITGPDAVLTGVSTGYNVTARLADGTSRAVTPTWSSSNPEVATVDSAGELEGRTHGSTTLTAASEGQTVSKTVHVVNNYGGTWEGRFTVKGCDATPPGVCAAQEVDFFDFDITLQISQTGTDQSDINAMLKLPSFFEGRANVRGRVSADGRLNLTGTSDLTDDRGTTWATFTVGAWDTTLTNGAMTGRWAQRINTVRPASTEYTENELVTMNRIGNATAGAMRVR
jgi:hypothetical protein